MVWLICQTAFRKGETKLLIRGVPSAEWVFCPMIKGIKNDKVSVNACNRCPRLIRVEQTFIPPLRTDTRGLITKRTNHLHFMKPPPSRCRAKPSTLRSLAPTLSLIEERQPIIDVFDEEDHLLILAQLPGMDRKDVKVKANDNTVTITAENATKKYLDTIRLPSHVMKGAVKFTYRNNILQAKLKKT